MEKNTQTEFKSPYNNLRGLLQKELLCRCQKNSQYSLRAFARSLKLEASALSKILHGKRNISKRMFGHLSQKLELSPSDQMNLLNLGNIQDSMVDPGFQHYQTLTMDEFSVISDWYHYAILEITKVIDFKPQPKWIATVLGITVTEVKLAVDRLKNLGFLAIDKDGQWRDISGNLTTIGNEFTAIALKKMQKQILEKAISAMDEIPMDKRNQTSITFAVDSRLLPQAVEEIKKFRRKMTRLLEASNCLDQVYNLSVSFYPVLAIPIKKPKKTKRSSK